MSSLGFPFRASSQDFKTRLLNEGFHTLINGGLFSSPTNVGHHNNIYLLNLKTTSFFHSLRIDLSSQKLRQCLNH